MLDRYFFARHLDDDEVIHYVVHKHWFMGLKVLLFPTVCFIGLWALLVAMPDQYVFYLVALVSVAVAVWWIRNFLDYYLDAWVVTNKGIIDLEWHGWFHRQSARILYSDIEAVSYEVNGILATLVGFGDMKLEKISTGSMIAMQQVRNPRMVESLILELMEKYLHKKNLKDATTVQKILAEFVAGTLQARQAESKKPTKK